MPVAILDALKELIATKDVVPKGPNSDPARQWLARAIALLRQVDPESAAEFETRASILGRRLSSDTLNAAWHDMLLILETTIGELELKTSGVDERVYSAGDAYKLYRDLSDVIGGAKTSVFVVDPYADDEVFDLYFAKCASGVEIRLLTKPATAARLEAVTAKFRQPPGVRFELRVTDDIHDRVIFRDDACWVVGTSIDRHAATRKPTYLIAVRNVGAMRAPYDGIWAQAGP